MIGVRLAMAKEPISVGDLVAWDGEPGASLILRAKGTIDQMTNVACIERLERGEVGEIVRDETGREFLRKARPMKPEPEVVIFIDLNSAPPDWREQFDELGIEHEGSEPQPIADLIKLRGCKNIPEGLPLWLRKA